MNRHSLLVVDDEEPVRSVLRAWFTMRGFEVDVATDGGAAVQRCRARRYDAVILDRDMRPMGGIEALPLLRDCHPDMPILVLSGVHNENDIFLQQGASAVCHKPIQLAELEKEVYAVLADVPLSSARQSPASGWVRGSMVQGAAVARRNDNPRITGVTP